ncbi:MAG: NUDIX domain-containing protein [Patescibacteria group bacterium]|nr:NUDIX domain-containing protein [Patescibacteria group bacterium]MDD4304194.1 NUDIX domain-containing protein [Patescibacteria group bacterium]MDD4695226.1 NUDIX domain-containing protein [Patescibacteria group bacterium]
MKKIKFLTFKEFKNIYSKVPRLCVECVIQTQNGIILTKRDIEPAKNKWHIPGGTILKGEKIKDAIKRIAKSETGLDINIIKLLGVIEYDFKNYFSQPIGIAYLLKPKIELNSKNKNLELKTNDQASKIKIFQTLPKNIIKVQRQFLEKNIKIKMGSD